MKSEQHVYNRGLATIIRDICDSRGLEIHSYSDDWILEISKEDRKSRIYGCGFDLNSSIGSMIAKDKVATYDVLSANGVPSVEHRVIRMKSSYGHWPDPVWGGGIVVKPLHGTSGQGVFGCKTVDEVKDKIAHFMDDAWTISPWLSIVRETRLIMLDGAVLLSYDKQPVIINGLKMFNLSKGSSAQIVTPTPEQAALAITTMDVLRLRLASVDIVELSSGEKMILEVNDSVAMEYFTHHSTEHKKLAYDVYDKIIAVTMNE